MVRCEFKNGDQEKLNYVLNQNMLTMLGSIVSMIVNLNDHLMSTRTSLDNE